MSLIKVPQVADHLPYLIREWKAFVFRFGAHKGFGPVARVDQVTLAVGLDLLSIDPEGTGLHAGIGDAATFVAAGCTGFRDCAGIGWRP